MSKSFKINVINRKKVNLAVTGVNESDTVSDLKRKIKEQHPGSVPEVVILSVAKTNGVLLEEKKTLKDCNIKEDTTLEMRAEFQVFVKTLNGGTVTLEVDKTDTVTMIKKQIEDKSGLAAEDLKLIHAGKQLADDIVLGEYDITRETTLHCVMNADKKPFRIHVNTRTKLHLAVTGVFDTDTVSNLKKKIKAQHPEPGKVPEVLILSVSNSNGPLLEEIKTMKDYGIKEDTTLEMRGEFQIFVKTLNGTTLTIEVDKTDTVTMIKKQIEERAGLAADDQRLIFAGKQLADDTVISEYDITRETTLHCVMRLVGG